MDVDEPDRTAHAVTAVMKLDENVPQLEALARQLGRIAKRWMRLASVAAERIQMGAQGLTVILRLGKFELPFCEPREGIGQPFIKRLRLNSAAETCSRIGRTPA